MKRADRLKAPLVFILGDDELARGEVTVKRMATSTQESIARDAVVEFARAASRLEAPGCYETRICMAEQLGDWTRTDTCGALRATDIGREVTLLGWVHRVRDLGSLVFLDLRDRYGLTQVVVQEGQPFLQAAKHAARRVRRRGEGHGAGARRPTRSTRGWRPATSRWPRPSSAC